MWQKVFQAVYIIQGFKDTHNAVKSYWKIRFWQK